MWLLNNFKKEVLSKFVGEKVVNEFFNLPFSIEQDLPAVFKLTNEFFNSLPEQTIYALSKTEISKNFNALYIDLWMTHQNQKVYGSSNLESFNVKIDNTLFYWYENKHYEANGFIVAFWVLLVELCKKKIDENFFLAEESHPMFAGKFRKIDSISTNLGDVLFIYGNGINKYFNIEWTDDNKLEEIAAQGAFRDFKNYPEKETEINKLANTIYIYSQIKTYSSELMKNNYMLSVWRSGKKFTYETIILLNAIVGNEDKKDFSADLEKYIRDAYILTGKEKLSNFNIATSNKNIYSLFVKSRMIWTTNYDKIYWKDPFIGKNVQHVHGQVSDNSLIFSNYLKKFKNKNFTLDIPFFSINKVIIFGWSGDHEPHINVAINGNSNITEIIVFDKVNDDLFSKYLAYIKYKILFPYKKVVVIDSSKINEYIEPFERELPDVHWND